MRIDLLTVCTALLVAACVPREQIAAPVTLRLLSFNDFHGNIQSADPSPGRVAIVKNDGVEMAEAGGAAYFATRVAAILMPCVLTS